VSRRPQTLIWSELLQTVRKVICVGGPHMYLTPTAR